jgi:DMSO/TMAO reductase YedYZ molybdopterin-dependent catalytic subunit
MMFDRPSRYELGLSAVGGAMAVGGSFALTGYNRSFVVAPIDAMVVRATPGAIVTYMIENVGAEAHLIHIAMSFCIAAVLFAGVTLAANRVAEHTETRIAGALAGGVLAFGLSFALVRAPVVALGAGVPVAVVTGVGSPRDAVPTVDDSRRRAIGAVGSTAGLLVAAAGVGALRSGGGNLADAPGTDDAEERRQQADAAALAVESADLPGLVSEIDNFYNVDITEFEPELTADEWSLTISGETNGESLTVEYDDLTERSVEHRFVTLRCVGEDINDKKLDTAIWTGTPLRPLLEEVDPGGQCGCAVLRGEDDYFVEYPTDVLEQGFLAWGMNGKELPPQHGHPVRILIPGHWGETNVKWLREIELIDEEVDGYWEQRGWEGTGTVKTVAKLWDEGITTLDDGRIELAGHAYAGTRGVQAVEVSTDGGATWIGAELSDPLPGDDVWRQYRHVFEPSGEHEVVVRAIDGNGDVQPREETDPFPTGSSGWVRRTVSSQ